PDSLGQGGLFPPASGHLESPDGPVLSQQRLAQPAQGCVRSIEPLQERPGLCNLGTGSGGAAGGRKGAGGVMNRDLVDRIAEALLYEGYMLYPYRPSVKNRQRWTFGGLYPATYCQSQGGSDAWSSQTECLVRGSSVTVLHVTVRFLHLTERRV